MDRAIRMSAIDMIARVKGNHSSSVTPGLPSMTAGALDRRQQLFPTVLPHILREWRKEWPPCKVLSLGRCPMEGAEVLLKGAPHHRRDAALVSDRLHGARLENLPESP